MRPSCRTSTTCATACCSKDEVTNIELGYKISLDRLALFATLFQTEFDNVPFHGHPRRRQTRSVRRAETRTRGIELEGEFQPLDALNVRFSMTQQDPSIANFTGYRRVDNTGNTIRRIPKTMGGSRRPTCSWKNAAART